MNYIYQDFLAHHGVKGQRKGHRRWQNEDGSYTEAGKVHYGIGDGNDKASDKDVEYLETVRGKKIAVEPYGMYKTMKTGKEVGDYIKDRGVGFAKQSARNLHDKDLKNNMNKVAKDYNALAKKYGKMKYSEINFKQLRADEKEIDDRYHAILTEATRRNYRRG